MCATAVIPVAVEAGVEIKCPYCRSGFLEEMETARGVAADGSGGTYPDADSAISIWAPIIDGMVGDPFRRPADAFAGADDDHGLDPLEFSRRRRRATAFLRLLQAIRERLESAAAASGGGLDAAEHYSPFGRRLFAAGPGGEQGMALGDYFLGPGLDALMQQLAESDAGRQGTLPAKKEAVETMPTVEVSGGGGNDDAASCAVCLEDYAPGRCPAGTGSTPSASCRGWRCTARAPCADSSCRPTTTRRLHVAAAMVVAVALAMAMAMAMVMAMAMLEHTLRAMPPLSATAVSKLKGTGAGCRCRYSGSTACSPSRGRHRRRPAAARSICED